MIPAPRILLWFLATVIASVSCRYPTARDVEPDTPEVEARRHLRIGLFNIRELRTEKLTQTDDTGTGEHPQARAAARIIQKIRPDVLVIQEIDHDYGELHRGLSWNARRFAKNYLETGRHPITYPFFYAAPNNTGILTGLDVDRDGHVATAGDLQTRAYGADSYGYGTYPGEYSMAILSRVEILEREARTFQKLRWKDLPGNHIPPHYFPPKTLDALRLSSKSHWDVPLRIGPRFLHLWISHPTPPVFDGDEDRNGRRNFDELKLWVEYLEGNRALVDDEGVQGAYESEHPFVIVGDLNADPWAPAVYDGTPAIRQLLDHPRLRDTGPWLRSRGGAGDRKPGPPAFPERATATFNRGVRVDYILPSLDVIVLGGGVFWPTAQEDPDGHKWAETASDHRLVWLDIAIP